MNHNTFAIRNISNCIEKLIFVIISKIPIPSPTLRDLKPRIEKRTNRDYWFCTFTKEGPSKPSKKERKSRQRLGLKLVIKGDKSEKRQLLRSNLIAFLLFILRNLPFIDYFSKLTASSGITAKFVRPDLRTIPCNCCFTSYYGAIRKI